MSGSEEEKNGNTYTCTVCVGLRGEERKAKEEEINQLDLTSNVFWDSQGKLKFN